MFTLFKVQYFTGVNLHLRLPISLFSAQPAVTGEHVVLSVIGNYDLNAVQEPAGAHAFVSVTNQEPVDLRSGGAFKVCHDDHDIHCFDHRLGSADAHLADVGGVDGEHVHPARLEVVAQVVVGHGQHHPAGVALLAVELHEHFGVGASSADVPRLHGDVIADV